MVVDDENERFCVLRACDKLIIMLRRRHRRRLRCASQPIKNSILITTF